MQKSILNSGIVVFSVVVFSSCKKEEEKSNIVKEMSESQEVADGTQPDGSYMGVSVSLTSKSYTINDIVGKITFKLYNSNYPYGAEIQNDVLVKMADKKINFPKEDYLVKEIFEVLNKDCGISVNYDDGRLVYSLK